MKKGLVLEGGALRTIYSAGVTDGFLELGVDFDYVVGVSAGMAYGVSYLSRQFGRNLEILTRFANDPRYMSFRNMLRPDNHHCYFGLKFTYDSIPNGLIPYDYEAFARWPGEAEAVVTDLASGRARYYPVDPSEREMRLLQATCAMPLLFPVYDLYGIRCLDGGAADPIPWKRALEKGCQRTVVVLTRERSYRRRPESLEPLIAWVYRKYPKFVDTIRRRADTYNEDREALFQAEREGKVFIFSPESTEGFSRVEKDITKINNLWQQGRGHAHARADALKAFLKG